MDLRTISAALAVATIAVAVAGCGGERPRPPRPTPAPAPATTAPATPAPTTVGWVRPPTQPGFDYTDPGQVCHRFGAALYSTDTTRDTGPVDAYLRAAAYASGALAAQTAAAARDGRWPVWSAHRAHVQTQLTPAGVGPAVPDNAVVAYRTVRISATAVGADGWRGRTEQVILDCTLGRGGPDGAGWRVTRYTLQTAGLP